MKSKNIKLDEFSYNTLISKAPKYEIAVEWFEKMKKKNIRANVYSYTTLIRKCENQDIAMSLLLEMKIRYLRPNAVTFGTILYFAGINEQKQKQLIQEFLEIFEPGKDFGMQEFRRLRMHSSSVLLFAEEIYKIAPQQKGFICMLLENVLKNKRTNNYLKNKAKELQSIVNCRK